MEEKFFKIFLKLLIITFMQNSLDHKNFKSRRRIFADHMKGK